MANPENASDATTAPKRARIDPALKTPSQGTEKAHRPVAPRSLATSFAKGHVATLHPQVSPIIFSLFEEYIALKVQIFHKMQQAKKMETNIEFFPRSARIDFTLHLSDEAQATDEYTTLIAETTKEIDAFKVQLKTRIIQATHLELYILRKKVIDLTTKALRITSKALLITKDPASDTHPTDQTARHAIQALRPSFLAATYFESNNSIIATYNKQHKTTLADIAPPATPIDNADSIVLNDATLRQQIGADGPAPNTVSSHVASTLTAIFVTAWDQYLDQTQRNTVSLKLQQFSVQALDEPATNNAMDVVQNEPNVDPKVVSDMIHAEVSKQTRQLNSTITQLRNKLDSGAKNRKGRSSSASSEKQTKRSSSNQRGKPKAGAAANATAGDKPKTSNAANRNKTKKKSSASKDKSSKPRQRRARK
jgi:hypothetical protein